jgi:rubrerythrin
MVSSQVEGLEARIEELTAAASTESTAKSVEYEQQLQQLREEKEEVDSYLSELEAAALREGETHPTYSHNASHALTQLSTN